MPAALSDDYLVMLDFVNDTIRFVYAPAPIPLFIALQWFGLANARKRMAVNVFEKVIDTP